MHFSNYTYCCGMSNGLIVIILITYLLYGFWFLVFGIRYECNIKLSANSANECKNIKINIKKREELKRNEVLARSVLFSCYFCFLLPGAVAV